MCPTYEYHCMNCSTTTDAQFEFSKRPEWVRCRVCDEEAIYKISMPSIMSTALPDGTRRAGFDVIREANVIEKEALKQKDPRKKSQLRKEANTVKSFKPDKTRK